VEKMGRKGDLPGAKPVLEEIDRRLRDLVRHVEALRAARSN